MAKKDKREKRKYKIQTAANRLAHHKGGGFERTCIDLPEGMSSFNPKKEGTYRIDIIPFIAGKGNPFAKEGMLYYERTYYNHRGIGPNQDSFVCLARTFGKKCPVCEYRIKLEKQGEDEKIVKALAPKQRQVFNVYDHDEPEKGVQVWEISFHNFGKHLDKKLRGADESKRARYEQFYHPDKGYTLRLGASEEAMGKQKFLVFSDIELKKREPLDPAVMDEAACLDDLLIRKDYDELKQTLLQTDDGDAEDDDEEDEDDDKPKKRKKGKETDDDDEDSDDDDDDEEGDSDDDDDDSNDDDDDSEGDDDEDDSGEGFEIGDKVAFVYKGKKLSGKIKKINEKKGLAQIKVPGQERLSVIELDELMEPKGKPKDDDDEDDDEEWDSADEDDESDDDDSEDDEDDDEDEDEPKPKKKKRKKR